MAGIKKERLWEDLKKGELKPAYLLYGPETFLRDSAAKIIADCIFSPDDLRDFNETSFSLNQPSNLRTALAAAEQLPMMSAKRLVRITDIRILSSGRLDTIKETDEGLLADFLARPPERSVVIFVADELNGTRKLSRLLKEKCVSVEFAQLDEHGRAKWASTEIQKAGSTVDDRALTYLISTVGSDLRRLSSEIRKLSTAALPNGQITIELIGSLVANSGAIGQWDLVNYLNAGRKDLALATLKKMLDDGEEPLMIIGQIAGNHRRSVLDGRADPSKMREKMKRLAAADLAIKTSLGAGGPIGARMQVEKLVSELALIR